MTKQRRQRRVDLQHHDIPTKANRILHLILIAICLIVIRVWYLTVIQYDQKLEESRKPQRKVVIEPATRATIRDRFNLPLAINKMSYQAAILYSQLRDIPSITWKKDESGKKVRVFKRREYIKQLSQLLGQELHLDPERIEDLIHAKASYYAQVPFVIKDEITENEYYRLKMLEKDWPGIHMSRSPKRFYPRGRTAADIVGYMGAINRQEYEKILHEMKALEQFITQRENGEEGELPFGIDTTAQARKRLRDLEEKAYTIHDYVGKTGIEGIYEEHLRGFYGRKNYYSDSKGNFLWELPGSRASLPGHRVLLTISAELQEYAEQLLAQNEEFRVVRKSGLGLIKKTVLAQKSPWIKGGSIVVMDPSTAEVLTLASFPRFDPNDFISSGRSEQQKEKKLRINRWFENESYIAQMWDLQQPFERERFDPNTGEFYDEKKWLTWSTYLDFVLPKDGPLRKGMDRIQTIHQAIELQQHAQALLKLMPDYDLYTILNLLYVSDFHEPYHPITQAQEKAKLLEVWQGQMEKAFKIKPKLDPYFYDLGHNYDKVLLVDLCRLAVNEERFDPNLIKQVGKNTLEAYRNASGALVVITNVVKEMVKEQFHDQDFKQWRIKEEKNYLKQKRIEEKAAKTYPKPYLDYFDQYENQLFIEFWEQNKWSLITAFLMGSDDPSLYLSSLNRWHQELKSGAHQGLDWNKSYSILRQAIHPLSSTQAVHYLQTMRTYQDLDRPLLGRYRGLRSQKNPLEKHLAATFYPIYGYGCGRSHAYRQATIQGSLFKLVTSYEALVQRYKKNPSGTELNPLIINDQEYMKGTTRYLGYTEDGKAIPQLYKGGRLPRSLAHRNTGRIDLVRALEVSSNPYFSMLAGDCLENPEDLGKAAIKFGFGSRSGIHLPGEIPGKVPNDLVTNRTGLYAMAIGQHTLIVTPLQTAVMLAAITNGGKVLQPKIVNLTAGREPIRYDDRLPSIGTFPYKEELDLIGLNFSPFTASFKQDPGSLVKTVPTRIRNELFMPDAIRKILLKGLQACVQRTYQENLSSLTKLYAHHPEAVMQFTTLKDQLLGKTSTSESVEHIDLDLEEGTNLYTHVWFGSISYDKTQDKTTFLFKDEFGDPELVVVVYLRYGGYGKEAAPLAAQIVKKWRELKQKYATPTNE